MGYNIFRNFSSVFRLSCGLCLLFLFYSRVSADSVVFHPDGKLGRLGGQISARYTSVTAEKGVAVSDIAQIKAGLIFPFARTVTLGGSYSLEHDDSLFHNFSISAKKYTADPTKSPINCNPDGKIGVPIISFGGSIRIADADPGQPIYQLSLNALVPISPNFTVGVGSVYYSESKPEHADDFFGDINFYPVRYASGREYENPDGIEGVPSFAFRAGGSKEGFFGQLAIVVPLQQSLSIGLIMCGEKLDFQATTKATLGAQVNIYPGN